MMTFKKVVELSGITVTYVILTYSRTSLIRTPKGQNEVSVLERCPYKRGHYDDVTFMTPLTVLSFQWLKPGSHSSFNCI